MTLTDDAPLCSISACPEPAVDSDQGEVGSWLVTIFYCTEHGRERDEGTPLGPVGIDSRRVRVEPLGVSEPQPGSNRFPGIA
jgi:hypothetical protein